MLLNIVKLMLYLINSYIISLVKLRSNQCKLVDPLNMLILKGYQIHVYSTKSLKIVFFSAYIVFVYNKVKT